TTCSPSAGTTEPTLPSVFDHLGCAAADRCMQCQKAVRLQTPERKLRPHSRFSKGNDMVWLYAVIAVGVVILIGLAFAVRIVKQYERVVLFELGKVKGGARGPGLMLIVPVIDRVHRVSLRIGTMPIQSQGIITKDNVSIDVSAVAYYRVEDPVRSVVAIENV